MSESLRPDVLPLIAGVAYVFYIQYSILAGVTVFHHRHPVYE